MEKKLNGRDSAVRLCFVILGNVIYALAVKFFLIPGGLVTVSRISQVSGRGFSMGKVYRKS